MLYYKVLKSDRTPYHGGTGTWTPKRWRRVRGALVACENAIHACRRGDLLYWLGPAIWTFEFAEEPIVRENKVYGRTGRILEQVKTWNSRTARLFACDCAERVMHFSPDPRVAACISTARRFANGEATGAELAAARAAAEAAAEVGAGDAAWAAVCAAVWAAVVATTGAGVWAAARDTAWAAADAAARGVAWAARDVERVWQTERLFVCLNGGGNGE